MKRLSEEGDETIGGCALAEGSYTVFVLPFAYQDMAEPEPGLAPDDRGYWAPLEFELETGDAARSPVWRLSYFLPETNLALFGRARWLELQGSRWGKEGTTCVPAGLLPKSIRVEWVRAVLFEAYQARTGQFGGSECTRNGMLLVKVVVTEPASLQHLL